MTVILGLLDQVIKTLACTLSSKFFLAVFIAFYKSMSPWRLEVRTNWYFTTDSLRGTGSDPAKPTPSFICDSTPFQVSVVTTTSERDRLLDTRLLIAEKGLLLSRASGGLPILELARLVLGVASAKALTRRNIPKLSFRTWTDGNMKSALPLWESRNPSFLLKLSPQEKDSVFP